MKIHSVTFEKRSRKPDEFPASPFSEVAFCGRSNVGKSSLMNCLLNRRGLVAVSGKPGKTRAIDFFLVNNAFRLVDLPGYGYARVSEQMQRQWKVLIEAYLRNRRELAGVVCILDIRRDIMEQDRQLLEWLDACSISYIPVCTKADKLSFSQRKKRRNVLQAGLPGGVDPLIFSARTGLGKAELWKRIHTVLSRQALTEKQSE